MDSTRSMLQKWSAVINNSSNYLSFESKLVYSSVSVLTALCAIFGNAFCLCWYIRDRKLKGCFYMFIGNLAASDLVFATSMATLNVVLLYDLNIAVCAVFRITILWPRQEIKLILVILTFDRIQLVKGIQQYRQIITNRSAKIMVVTSWIVSVAFSTLYAVYLFVLHDDERGYTVERAMNCHTFFTTYVDIASLLNLLVDTFLFLSYIYVLALYQQTQRIMSSIELQDRVEQTESTKPSPRESAAYYLHGVAANVLSVDSSHPPTKAQSSCTNLKHISENSKEKTEEETTGVATTTITTGGKEGRDTDDICASAAGAASNDKIKENVTSMPGSKDTTDRKKHSVLFDGRVTRKTKPEAAPEGTNTKCRGSHCSQSPHTTATSFQRDSGDLFYPAIKSRLPLLLTKPSKTKSLRCDAIAAQQLGLFLAMHFLMGMPLDVCYLIGSITSDGMKENITVYVLWLLWLSLLRAVFFPCLYCVYSARLRSHFRPFLRFRRCLPARVSPSRDTLSTHKNSLEKPKD